jgi:hypothetical protein
MFARSFQSLDGMPDTGCRIPDAGWQFSGDFQGLTVDAILCYINSFFMKIWPFGVSL